MLRDLWDNLTEDFGWLGCLLVVGLVLVCSVISVGVIFINAAILFFTWNYALCALFPAIPLMGSYWMALGIQVLLTITISGIKGIIQISVK